MTPRKGIIAILAAIVGVISQVSAVSPTPLPTLDTTATTAMQTLTPWDFLNILPALAGQIGNRIGLGGQTVFYASMLVVILVALALRQESMLIPMVLFAVFGASSVWTGIIPAQYEFYIVDAFVVFTVAGIIYTTYTRIRKG